MEARGPRVRDDDLVGLRPADAKAGLGQGEDLAGLAGTGEDELAGRLQRTPPRSCGAWAPPQAAQPSPRLRDGLLINLGGASGQQGGDH